MELECQKCAVHTNILVVRFGNEVLGTLCINCHGKYEELSYPPFREFDIKVKKHFKEFLKTKEGAE